MSERERRSELSRFLKDRRARIGPADVGLPSTPRRRVRGLRREEVALLAGIGVSWYTALENGDALGVDEHVGELPPLVADAIGAISFPAYVIKRSPFQCDRALVPRADCAKDARRRFRREH
jgi:hypothetical protein